MAYDPPGGERSAQSGLIKWNEGKTAIPPSANIPANWKDDNDPHRFPCDAKGSLRQQSHFLRPRGRLIDARKVIEGSSDCWLLPDDD